MYSIYEYDAVAILMQVVAAGVGEFATPSKSSTVREPKSAIHLV